MEDKEVGIAMRGKISSSLSAQLCAWTKQAGGKTAHQSDEGADGVSKKPTKNNRKNGTMGVTVALIFVLSELIMSLTVGSVYRKPLVGEVLS